MPLSRYDILKSCVILDRRSGGGVLLIPAQITAVGMMQRAPGYRAGEAETFYVTPVGGTERPITAADEVMLASEIGDLAAVLFPVTEAPPVIAPSAPAGDAVVPF